MPLTAGRPTPADERVAGSLDGARFRQVLPPLAHERPEWLRDLDDHEDDHEDEDVPEPVGTEEHHLEDEMGNKKLTTEERRQRLREALHEAGKAGLGATDLKVLNLRMGASKSGHLRDVRALLADGSMTYKGEKSGRRYFASPKSAPAPARVVDHPPSAGAKNHACTYPDLNVERAPVADAYAAVLADLQSRLTTAQDAKARAVEAVRAAEEDRARAYTLAEEIEASIRLLRKVS